MLGTILFTISVGRYTTIYSDPPNWKDETVISRQPYILSPCQGTIYSHGNGWMKNKWFSSHNFLPSTVALSLWKVIGTVSFGKYHLNSAFINFSFSFFNSKITAWVGENSIANKDWTKAESWSHLMWCWHQSAKHSDISLGVLVNTNLNIRTSQAEEYVTNWGLAAQIADVRESLMMNKTSQCS